MPPDTEQRLGYGQKEQFSELCVFWSEKDTAGCLAALITKGKRAQLGPICSTLKQAQFLTLMSESINTSGDLIAHDHTEYHDVSHTGWVLPRLTAIQTTVKLFHRSFRLISNIGLCILVALPRILCKAHATPASSKSASFGIHAMKQILCKFSGGVECMSKTSLVFSLRLSPLSPFMSVL